jgi:hypothetical protein
MAQKILNDLPVCTTPAAGNWLLIETPSAAQKLDVAWLTSPTGAAAAVTAHINDALGAHQASAIAFAPAGSITSTDVQAAIVELMNDAVATRVALIGEQDIEVTDAGRGVVLRSPNGSRWRLRVDDDGDVKAVAV